ncbi:MAG: o-succinylbenzoate synthase [Bacteroidales bacterium]|nr:o-succinylbenzoate synthase [Bacteroidales bacterium]
MIKAAIRHKIFNFRQAATTSRGILTQKSVYFILLYEEEKPFTFGIGECSLFPGLSMDDVDGFEKKLNEIVGLINKGLFNFKAPVHNFPSVNFALETAKKDLDNKGSKVFYQSEFTQGNDSILINGLIWMGTIEKMKEQIENKLNESFTCIKVKIGALDFKSEYELLSNIRKEYNSNELEIRVDANGAFTPFNALEHLKKLSDLDIHSVEQPILPSQLEEMAALCLQSPLPIALDEELIGKFPAENKLKLLQIVKPQYIVIKPGLLGGIQSCEEWIDIANDLNIRWWVTSALETNIGLNVIAQWTYTLKNPVHQGLSTGTLYVDNIDCPLVLSGEKLYYFPKKKWNIKSLT